MAHLKIVLAEATANVQAGKAWEQRIADGGYSLRVQRTTRWNQRHQHIITHVWHREEGAKKSKLVPKAVWAKLIA